MIAVYQAKSDESFVTFMYGMGKFDLEWIRANLDRYSLKAHLMTVDLDRAFEIGNIGPEEYYVRHDRMHSVSVGDILVKENGTAYVVAPSGFDELGLDVIKEAA